MPLHYTASMYTIRFSLSIGGKIFNTDMLPGNQKAKDIIKIYLNALKSSIADDKDNQKCLRVKYLDDTHEENIFAIVESGDYGRETPILDIVTKEESIISKTQASMWPFGLFMSFKAAQNEGIVVFQRSSGIGIKTSFMIELQKLFEEKCGAIKVDMHPLCDEKRIDLLLGEGVKKIRVVKSKIPTDIADDLSGNDNIEDVGAMELMVRARRKKPLIISEKIKDFITGKTSISNGIEINGVEYNNIKIEFKTDSGLSKVLNVAKINDFSMPIDIMDVEIGKDGWPSPESLKGKMSDLSEYGRKLLNWQPGKEEGDAS